MEENKDLNSNKIKNSIEASTNKTNYIKDLNSNKSQTDNSINIIKPTQSQFIPINNGQPNNNYSSPLKSSTSVKKNLIIEKD